MDFAVFANHCEGAFPSQQEQVVSSRGAVLQVSAARLWAGAVRRPAAGTWALAVWLAVALLLETDAGLAAPKVLV